MDNIVIALDGPAGSGKSTLAKRISQYFNIQQIDSGAIYRTYTYQALEYCYLKNISLEKEMQNEALPQYLASLTLQIVFQENKQEIFVNNIDMEPFIRNTRITNHIQYIADHPLVRDLVNKNIRKLASKYSVVVDGRDIGTVVFPLADLKFFIDAELKERVKRRAKEMREKRLAFDPDSLYLEMKERDEQDRNRKIGGLKRAKDAIFIDTTRQSLDVAFQSVQKIVEKSLFDK